MENLKQHPLLIVTPEEMKKIRQAFNLDDVHRVQESLEAIEEWVKKQDHLATAFQYVDRNMLERLLLLSRGSIEGTKTKIDKLFTMRAMIPDINLNKSIEEFENISDCMVYVPLPNLCPSDQSRVTVSRPVAGKFDEFNLLSYIRYCFLAFTLTVKEHIVRKPACLRESSRISKDVWSPPTRTWPAWWAWSKDTLVPSESDLKKIGEFRLRYDYCISERYILDLQFVNMGILTKLNPVILKKAEIMCTEGFGSQIKGLHIINAPSFVDKIVFIMKQGLKEKVASRLYVHNSYEDLYKEIPKDILPKDYGGDGPSCEKLAEQWKDFLKSKEARRIVDECNNLVVDESKRSEMKFNEEYLGMPGSFRKLTVD